MAGFKRGKKSKKQDARGTGSGRMAVSLFSAPGNLRKADERSESVPLWLITFTDIVALMLTFFVLLYSMAVPEEEKWDEMTSTLNRGLSKFESPKWYRGPQDTINIDKIDLSSALNLDYLYSIVAELIAGDEKLQNVVLIPQHDRLVMSLPIELIFESGQSEVTMYGKKALFTLGGPLSRIRNRIEVIGHADPRPIEGTSEQFASNWDLSLSRAVNVSAVLENVGYVRPVIVRGLSSARYDELPADIGEEQRLSLSRRVDLVIMKDDGSQKLLFSP